jgi:hypothetical protein
MERRSREEISSRMRCPVSKDDPWKYALPTPNVAVRVLATAGHE